MMSAEAKGISPRVNSSMLQAYAGRTVLFVGKVVSSDPSAATSTLLSSDGAEVLVRHDPGALLEATKVVEVCGEVQPDNSIRQFQATVFDDHFNMENYDAMVRISQNYGDIFKGP